MRIKHWQGYGAVEAKRVPDKSCRLHIQVKGNHEWGLVRDDSYDLFNWLVKRFDRKTAKETDVFEWERRVDYKIVPSWDSEEKQDVCDYYFWY